LNADTGGDGRWRIKATVDGIEYETDYESYSEAVFNLAKWNREFGQEESGKRKADILNKSDWPPVRKPPPPPPATQPAGQEWRR
jgi:hypothetical protein